MPNQQPDYITTEIIKSAFLEARKFPASKKQKREFVR